MIKLSGKETSYGKAIGKAYLFKINENIIDNYKINNIDEELKKIDDAIRKALNELDSLINNFKDTNNTVATDIFTAQKYMLLDPDLKVEINLKIKEGFNAIYAFDYAINNFKELLIKTNNNYINEKIDDINDIKSLVINILTNQKITNLKFNEDTIIVTDVLTPQMTANLDLKHIKGIITKKGSPTSHAAILSKHLGIPSLANVNINIINNNDILIMDSQSSLVIVNPDSITLNKYIEEIKETNNKKELMLKYLNQKALTKDNYQIKLLTNISNLEDAKQGLFLKTDGIGLYRTENQFLGKTEIPTINNLYDNYIEILDLYKDLPVTIRTLDIGGDKPLTYARVDSEANPFLGNRGIRFLLTHEEIFIIQLKALFKANKHNNLQILLPMISTTEELDKALKIINDTFNLVKQTDPLYIMPKIGIMVEVLSTALAIDKFLDKIDFISIGTNDLIQYLFAADRTNEKVSYLYQPYHPVLLNLINDINQKAINYEKHLSVCGEMASDPIGQLILIGLGINSLSMNYNQLLTTKYNLSNIELTYLNKLANKALSLNSSKEVYEIFKKSLKL